MANLNMKINDNLYFSDSGFHGYVIAKDQNGNIIFEKNNMVVQSGREAILHRLGLTCLDIIPEGDKRDKIEEKSAFKKFSSVKFGSGINMTTMYMDDLTSEITDGVSYPYSYSISESSENVEISFDIESRKIIFNITVDTSKPAELSELGLFFKNENDDELMFSRVVFDPIYCGANAAVTSFDITYYLYL